MSKKCKFDLISNLGTSELSQEPLLPQKQHRMLMVGPVAFVTEKQPSVGVFFLVEVDRSQGWSAARRSSYLAESQQVNFELLSFVPLKAEVGWHNVLVNAAMFKIALKKQRLLPNATISIAITCSDQGDCPTQLIWISDIYGTYMTTDKYKRHGMLSHN